MTNNEPGYLTGLAASPRFLHGDYFKEEGSMERRLIDADGGVGVAALDLMQLSFAQSCLALHGQAAPVA